MGAAFGAELRAGGHDVMWCPHGRSDATVARATLAGLRAVSGLPKLVATATVVLSICPPAFAEDTAAAVADAGFAGIYVDANAISPVRMTRIAKSLGVTGARAVDGSIFGAPPGDTSQPRLYLAGPTDTHDVAALFGRSRVQTVVLGDQIGLASALKMSFISYQRTARSAAALANALANHHGLGDALLAEAAIMPSDLLIDRDFLPTLTERAWRWGPEMHEAADTLIDAGLPGEIAAATAAVLSSWSDWSPRTTR